MTAVNWVSLAPHALPWNSLEFGFGTRPNSTFCRRLSLRRTAVIASSIDCGLMEDQAPRYSMQVGTYPMKPSAGAYGVHTPLGCSGFFGVDFYRNMVWSVFGMAGFRFCFGPSMLVAHDLRSCGSLDILK